MPTLMGKPRAKELKYLSWKKQIVFAFILMVSALLCLEGFIRVASFLIFDRSPFFLFYGIESFMGDENRGGHSVVGNGYFKFEAGHTLQQYGMFKKPTPIRINNIGVRGKDVTLKKGENDLRIISLGESSTFGFYSRDEYTYPAQLEKLLQLKLNTRYRTVEVINAGIPHANSDNILAFLKEELLGYSPDIVTLYAGYNDAIYVMDATRLQRLLRWLHGHVTIYVAMKRLIEMLGGPELYSKWARYGTAPSPDYIANQIHLHAVRYRDNLEEIVRLCKENKVKLIYIMQGVNPLFERKNDRSLSFTYQESIAAAQGRLRAGHVLSSDEVVLLIHGELMNVLEAVAGRSEIPVVDNRTILNEHPEYFASYVHLTEDGNAALAQVLQNSIMKTLEANPGVSPGESARVHIYE